MPACATTKRTAAAGAPPGHLVSVPFRTDDPDLHHDGGARVERRGPARNRVDARPRHQPHRLLEPVDRTAVRPA